MALKETGRVKTVEGNTDLTIQAEANESFRIRDIMIDNPTDDYITCMVDRLVVAFYRVGGTLGNHLNFPISDEENASLFSWLWNENIFRTIPVPSGMQFKIEGAAQSGAIQTVIYDVYDKNDVRANEPNGVESLQYDLIQYGRFNTTLADGDNEYDTQQTSGDYPSFPFEQVVPAKHTFTMHGILFSDVANDTSTGTNQQKTKFVKLVKDRVTLKDDDRQGLPYIGGSYTDDTKSIGIGSSMRGNYSDVDERLPLIFEQPLVFRAGDDLDVIITTALDAGSANLANTDAEIGLIFTVQRES